MTASRRIRVARVIARMNVGGPALQVTEIARGLDSAEFDHVIFTGNVESGEADYLSLRAPDVAVHQISGLGRSIRYWSELLALEQLTGQFRRFQPDIVHTHTAKAGVLGRLAARRAAVPVTVHTFHGHLLHGYFGAPVNAAVRLTERKFAKSTTRLVAVGARVRDDLLRAGIGRPDQYVVVPPGVAMRPAPDRLVARHALGLEDHDIVFCFVARLTSIKRPDRFIEAALDVRSRVPRARFIVAGAGELLDPLRALAAPLGDSVRFLGWRGDVETVYAASDVAVLTSDSEGMPVSLIEAAMSGVPAVTTDVGSASEVVLDGVTGLVTTTEVSDIAEAMYRLAVDDQLRLRLSEAAGARGRSRFSAARLVEDTAALYRSLVRS